MDSTTPCETGGGWSTQSGRIFTQQGVRSSTRPTSSPAADIPSPASRGFRMCIRVQYVPLDSLVPWDADALTVSVPEGTPRGTSLLIVRTVLEQLAIIQPPFGARCFCGAPVRLLPRVPQQRRSEQVTHHGA
jgi:hypothetical protein